MKVFFSIVNRSVSHKEYLSAEALPEVDPENMDVSLFHHHHHHHLGPRIFPLGCPVLVIHEVDSTIRLDTLLPAVWQRPLESFTVFITILIPHQWIIFRLSPLSS